MRVTETTHWFVMARPARKIKRLSSFRKALMAAKFMQNAGNDVWMIARYEYHGVSDDGQLEYHCFDNPWVP